MDRETKFLIDFQGFVHGLIADHFEVVTDAAYFQEFHHRHSLRYAQYLWTNEAPIKLTNEQIYLKSLSDLVTPLLEIHATRKRISRARSRSGNFGASSTLIGHCQVLAHGSYRFYELIKTHFKSVEFECTTDDFRNSSTALASKILRSFKNKHSDILSYRNYLVHPGRHILDPFRDLVYFEISAITLHNDLWLDYENEFQQARDFWKSKAISLLTDMMMSASEIKLFNQHLVSEGGLKFASAGQRAP